MNFSAPKSSRASCASCRPRPPRPSRRRPYPWNGSRARYGDLLSGALKYAFHGDEERIVELGRRAFLYDLKTLYRVFIKLMSPGFVIDRASRVWLTDSRDNGSLSARKLSDTRCEVSYDKIRAIYPGFWSHQRGCLLASVQATGYPRATAVVSRPDDGRGNAVIIVDWA